MDTTVGAAASARLFGQLHPVVQVAPDGSMLVRTETPLGEYARCLTDRLHHWAAIAPDRVFIAQRDGSGGWRKLTYGETSQLVRRIGSALLARGLSAERPILILSGNSIDHALMALGAMDVGIPYCPLSTAYSLISQDFGKLYYALELLTPGLVFAAEGKAFARALKASRATQGGENRELMVSDESADELGATRFASLFDTPVSPEAEAAHAAITPDTIGKFLLTSGSTGFPKAVSNTQRLICSNQVMIHQALTFLQDEPPVMLDWLPWAHTFGSNHNFGIALYNGGSLYLDDGKPVPGGIDATVRNIRDVSPTIYFNVPKGYEALLPHLEADAELRKAFFGKLNLMFYAGAGLARPIWDAYLRLGQETTGRLIPFTTSLGATETGPAALFNARIVDRPGIIGLPMAGVELKLVPNAGKLEARLRGPNITDGYWRRADLTAAAFDEDGFYKLGDALKPADPQDFSLGLIFDGRVAEDFKLATGTWVSVTTLRTHVVGHFTPLISDVVITGHDRDDVGMLVFPDFAVLRNLTGRLTATPDELIVDPAVRAALLEKLRVLAKESTGSSTRIVRALLMTEPPSIDLGEITDKGSLNQRAILANRAALVERLYDDTPEPHILTIHDKV